MKDQEMINRMNLIINDEHEMKMKYKMRNIKYEHEKWNMNIKDEILKHETQKMKYETQNM